jgi:hypothetical protein
MTQHPSNQSGESFNKFLLLFIGVIVDFLVESFEKGWVDQLIVTTFEESIIRKFHDHEKVNIIAI